MAYLTAAQLRASVSALADEAKFPDATLDSLVAEFEGIAERYRGVAFEPRTVDDEEHFIARDATRLRLGHVFIRSIASLTISGSAVSSNGYFLDKVAGVVVMPFVQNTTVVPVYDHGLDEPTDGLLRGCREYVRSCALSDRSGVHRDVITQADGSGGYTRFSTPDWDAGRPTGWLEVDRILNSLPDYRANSG